MAIKLKKGFVLRKIGPMYSAVPFGKMTTEIKGMISLTESGYLLWQALDKGAETVDELVAIMLDTYDVDRDTAAKDVNEFLDYLREVGVIEA
ncbi:MAG: PqqD family protein [Clostridia bacterium]|nr:PqqD family protein [Clostridia bacterium]